jgi:hypothetical protein
MDNFRKRFEALEQQTEQLQHETQALTAHTRTVERRLRWWRGFACGVVLLALLSRSLQSGPAADTQPGGMGDRMATLEKKLSAMAFDDAANEVVITGANLRIVNGLGATDTTNGVGNLIVGYNELRQELLPACSGSTELFCTDTRMGSHNIVVGRMDNFSRFGGLVVGDINAISGDFASVSGGNGNTASRDFASVSGGGGNTASGFASSVSGGESNIASSLLSTVSGGSRNTARDTYASVSGGQDNTASGAASSVSGGANRAAPAQFNSAAGALFSDH